MATQARLVSREARPQGTRVRIGNVVVGGEEFVVAAGPCAVETVGQVRAAAEAVAGCGARILRGGAFKPRTSPYAFQGLGAHGLDLLAEAGRAVGLPIVTEVLSTDDVDVVARHADCLQVGARNMQNFALLEALGSAGKPVLLKRGLSATIEELLLAAEYVVFHGNPDVVLCERGIRTFETATRNTLDLGAVAVLRGQTHLPILVDPSHAAGRRDLVLPLSLAAAAVGADGLLVEVHPDPAAALCDGAQSLDPAGFAALMDALGSVVPILGRTLSPPTSDQAGPHRSRIDRIDEALVRLLRERAEIGVRLGLQKRAAGRPVRSPDREEEVLGHVSHVYAGPLPADAVVRVFRAIIDETRGIQ